MDLTELIKPTSVPAPLHAHVIFVHGVNGFAESSWLSRTDPKTFWPQWLSEDDANIAVWSVGYPAGTTRWRKKQGSAMALPDRGKNILHRLLLEPALATGNIVFVGYSYGGLVIKQLLREAQTFAEQSSQADSFITRTRRVMFLSTPHLGSDQATLANALSLLSRPHATTVGLSSDDSYLRNLNEWFRGFAIQHGLGVWVLYETQPLMWGLIVKPSSADPGIMGAIVTPVDENHDTIRSPRDRDSEVYVHLQAFIRESFGRPQLPTTREALKAVTLTSDAILSETLKMSARVGELMAGGNGNSAVTAAGERELLRLRKLRHLPGFDAQTDVPPFINSLTSGDFAPATKEFKQRAFAWAARMLAAKDQIKAQAALDTAKEFGNSPEIELAEAFLLLFSGGNKDEALAIAAKGKSPLANTAVLLIASHGLTEEEAVAWVNAAGLKAEDLDAEGKAQLIRFKLQAGDWDGALVDSTGLTSADFSETAVLSLYAASANLAQVIHPDFRPGVISNLPADVGSLRLSSDSSAMEFRERAEELFFRAAEEIAAVGGPEGGENAAEFALWLRLRHPSRKNEAIKQLEKSMADAQLKLRRLPMALAFGLKIDFAVAEREIEQETIRSGGKSIAAAVARLALAEHRNQPAETARDIEKHYAQLSQIHAPAAIDLMLIEALAKSSQIEKARERLAKLDKSQLPSGTFERIEHLVEESAGADLVTSREELFKASGSLIDLINLVGALRQNEPTTKLVEYSKKLFDETKELSDARTFIQAAYRIGKNDALIQFAKDKPEIIESAADLKMLVAWAQYRIGNLAEAKRTLESLRANREDNNQRQLRFNLAIASGDWSALGTYVEEEWAQRDDRSAVELVRAGHVARCVGLSQRARELIFAASVKGADHANVLLHCYTEATAAGWEDDPQVHKWLERAFNLSGEDGPVRQVDFREVVEMIPIGRNKAVEIWDELLLGSIPNFLAARPLHRSLLDVYLRPALMNRTEQDPRHRGLVFAFSGARRSFNIPTRTFALDPTALVTLSILGALKDVLAFAERIEVPHSTLGWLFDERQKLEFHQPSQVARAKRFQSLILDGTIRKFEGGHGSQIDEEQFGDDIARFLTAARAPDGANTFIVSPFPITKPGSLLEEVADTRAVNSHFVGCGDVVRALRSAGRVTASEEERAQAYLGNHEKPWPHAPKVPAGATLLLDDLSISYLATTGMLEKLRGAGFRIFASEAQTESAAALTAEEDWSAEAKQIVEDIRAQLSAGIASGKVHLQPLLVEIDESESQELWNHPTASILGGQADYIVVDDRFFNRQGQIDAKFTVTTIDLLGLLTANSIITEAQCLEHLTSLRRFGYAFVPYLEGEISKYLASSPVLNGVLQESAELRAVRESILRIRMTNALQLPSEGSWMDGLFREMLKAVREQWDEGIPDDDSRARSKWILEVFDCRGWAHSSPEGGVPPLERYRVQVSALLMLPCATPEVRQRYFAWVEEELLGPLRDEQSEHYEALIASVRSVVKERLVETDEEEAPNGGKGAENA